MKTLLATMLIVATLPAYAATKTVRLSVPDMSCAACPITVKKVLSKIDGVSLIQVSAKSKEVVVTYDDARTNVQALTTATANVGYPSTIKEETR